MSKTIVKHTSQACFISFSIITKDTNGLHLSTIPIVSLTWFLMAIWSIRQGANRIRFEVATIADDTKTSLQLIGKVLIIGFNSLTWGMGL